MSDIISRSANSETYLRDGKPVVRERHNRVQSPLQRQRSQCLKEQMTGKHFPNREAQQASFKQAVKFCAQKFPKR